jgi:hypothetical protein
MLPTSVTFGGHRRRRALLRLRKGILFRCSVTTPAALTATLAYDVRLARLSVCFCDFAVVTITLHALHWDDYLSIEVMLDGSELPPAPDREDSQWVTLADAEINVTRPIRFLDGTG